MSQTFRTTDMLGVRIACLDRTGLLSAFEAALDSDARRSSYRLTYVNTHCFNLAGRDPAYRENLNRFDLVYADGFGAVLAAYLLGSCRLEKLTGADWMLPLFDLLAARGVRVFLLAGRPGAALKAAQQLQKMYPGFLLAGTADGFFESQTEAQVLAAIRESAPEVLFVGMGSPRQDAWILRHADTLPVKICWAVGALFDYAAGLERRAPRWMLALQLEWLWRLAMDPTGKWRRYLVGTPRFLFRVLAARFRLGGDRQA